MYIYIYVERERQTYFPIPFSIIYICTSSMLYLYQMGPIKSQHLHEFARATRLQVVCAKGDGSGKADGSGI